MFPFPNRDTSVHRDWPADVRYVAAEDGARITEKGELGVALGNDRPLAFIRVQILVKTTVNDKRQKVRIPATKLRSSYTMPTKCAISDAFVRDCVFAYCASVAQYVYSLSAEHCFRLRSSAISDERVRYCALCTHSVA